MFDAVALQLRSLQRCGAALCIARAADDHLAELIASMRAKRALRTLARLVAEDSVGDTGRLVAIEQTMHDNQLLLDAQPSHASTSDHERIIRWIAARDASGRDDPDLFEVDVCDVQLGLFSFAELFVVKSRFASVSLRGSTFDRAVFEDCDLSHAELERTSWRGAALIRCVLNGCCLIDAVLDDATFVDCVLYNAQLGAARATARGASFVRCDLRGTYWHARALGGTRFDGCRFFGTHGEPLVDGVEIEKPDLSPGGDGTRIGTARDVLEEWRLPRFGRR